ncbi:MAG: hypothetical protein KKF12_15660 [Proteobacteria bacterium]|nr:hypothetical protein [Desulfobacula sp.]MBU3950970.1 hypothetical protein [Pseudomonadota bacterium]MBU4132250.1 hypothetical protein [Pseudomonadota bacterium]
MLNTTSNTLIKLAALIWYTGFVVLIAKSGALFLEAMKGGADQKIILMAILFGIVMGKIKAQYLFNNICKKNIDRIKLLKNPKLWQFYRKRFFVFLFSMIVLGNYLSSAARGEHMVLIALAVLELSIAIALILSSHNFWET